MDVAIHTPRNLFEVKRKLATLEVDSRVRADLSSALNAVGKTQLAKPAECVDDILQTISVDAAGLAAILHKRTGARFGYTKEGWRNIGWRVRRALQLTGAWDLFHAKKIELSPEWALVLEGAKPSYLRLLARWAMLNGITPAELNDTHLDPFFRWLSTWKIRDYARRCYTEAIREWNRAASSAPNWPGAPLTYTTVRKEHYSVNHNRWPDELLYEVDAIIGRFAEPDIDDDEGPENAAPLTLKTHRSVLMRTLSAYSVGSGVPPEQITTVALLMDPKNAKIAFAFMLKWRQKTKPEIQKTSEIHGAAKLVSQLAMRVFRHNIPADHVLELQQMARRRNPKRKGLSKKNRDIQRLFDDESFEARFLHKPFQIMEELAYKPKTRRAAVSAMVTLAVAMSIEAPIRPGNQELLILGQHVWRFRRGNEECLAIRLPADEVKNDEDLDFELTGPIVEVYDLYIDKFRPLLSVSENRYLFPGVDRGAKAPKSLSQQMARWMDEHLGARVTAQAFRHIAGYCYLRANAGDYETVREFLGHRDINMTMSFYAAMERREAGKRLGKHVAQRRNQLRPRLKRTRRRVQFK